MGEIRFNQFNAVLADLAKKLLILNYLPIPYNTRFNIQFTFSGGFVYKCPGAV